MGRRSRMRKDVVGCDQAMVGKKKLLSQFEDGQKKDMSSVLLSYECSK